MGTGRGGMAMSAAELAAQEAVGKRLARLMSRPEADPEIQRWAKDLTMAALAALRAAQ